MNKSKKIAIVTVVVLAVILVITGVLNKKGLEQRKEMLEDAKITLKINGDEIAVATFEDIKLDGEEFEAVLDTSNTEPHTYSYTGVQIKDLLSKYNIDLNGANAIIFTAVDGYTVAYSIDEVLEEGNVYVAYERDGELLKTRENGGRGPYQTIVTKDQFSNRRCKWLTTIEVQNMSGVHQEQGMTLKANGEEIAASFEDIKSAGEEEFKAILDTSKTEPHTYSYTGVQVKNLLEKYDIGLNDAKAVIFTADDGYSVAYSVDEVLEENNVYVTYAREGERFKTKENGGKGPYISIIVTDEFSNRRCKYLTSIEVQN